MPFPIGQALSRVQPVNDPHPTLPYGSHRNLENLLGRQLGVPVDLVGTSSAASWRVRY